MNQKTPKTNIFESVRFGMVHFILSHSYIIFMFAIIFGAFFHTFFSIKLFSTAVSGSIGFVMLLVGPALIYWAQHTSSCSSHDAKHDLTERDFERGPYKYSRNPTHIGLTIMTLGLGFVLNSFFTVIFIIIASVITKLVFLKKEEAILEKKYGQVYCEYKRKVNTWV